MLRGFLYTLIAISKPESSTFKLDYSDEQVLIQQLLKRDNQAYRYAVQSYQKSMQYVAKSIVGTAIADEIVQDAWLSVIKALPKFEGRSSLKTWILRIVSNSAKSRLRKESRQFAAGDAADLEILSNAPNDRFNESGHWSNPPKHWDINSPEALIASDELRDIVKHTIEKLPALQQSIITLRDMECIGMEEICKILEISESNSRVLLHRARTKIWQAIDKHQGKENVEL